jgi:hypothetical protein
MRVTFELTLFEGGTKAARIAAAGLETIGAKVDTIQGNLEATNATLETLSTAVGKLADVLGDRLKPKT